MVSIKNALLRAIAYADIFDFPLTKDELFWFAETKITSVKEIVQAIHSLHPIVSESKGFYFLKDRKDLIPHRLRRQEASKKKEELGRVLGSHFSYIPTVEFVGISGGVAAGNAESGDDIDFFIITKSNTIWPTRLLLLVFLHFLGRRRSRDSTVVKDMACINMFLDAGNLQLPSQMRTLYTAHEIVQMVPIFSRGEMYKAFLEENAWVFSSLPQARKKIATYRYIKKPSTDSLLLRMLKKKTVVQLSKFLQHTYMKRKKEESLRTDSLVAFYPQIFGSRVLEVYQENLRALGIKK